MVASLASGGHRTARVRAVTGAAGGTRQKLIITYQPHIYRMIRI